MINVSQLTEQFTNQVTEAVKSFDASKFDPTKLDFSNFDLSKIEMPKWEMPKFEMPDLPKWDMPKWDMPKWEMPKFEMPDVDVPAEVDKIADFVRDLTYAGIGATVIVAQKVDAEVRKLVGQAA